MTKHKNEIIKLYEQGYSYSEISKKLGCSKGTISYHIGHGQKEKTLNRQNDKRNKIQKYIQEYKQLHPCVDCKESYPYWIMEFDHLSDKLFTIGSYRNSTNSIEKIIKEIEKCEVVCSNCHRNRTYLRKLSNGNSSMDISYFYKNHR